MSTSGSPPKVLTPASCGARCSLCPYAKDGMANRPVRGDGPVGALGLIVGESPGSEEAARGVPLVGNTGKEFDKSLALVKLPRGKLFIINSIACQPSGPKSEAKMKLAAESCRPYVLAQLEQFSKRRKFPVLTMGAWAFFSLHGHKIPLDRGRGFLRAWNLDQMKMAEWDVQETLRLQEEARARKEIKDAKKVLQAARPSDRPSKGG